MKHQLEVVFAGLRTSLFRITSPATPEYNCVAWAASHTEIGWWPDPMQLYFWPPGIPRQVTMDAFVAAFGTLGYAVCDTADLEPGFEKIAIYVDLSGRPTHVARQLRDGQWTSKLGKREDIEHQRFDALIGSDYGFPVRFLKRPV